MDIRMITEQNGHGSEATVRRVLTDDGPDEFDSVVTVNFDKAAGIVTVHIHDASGVVVVVNDEREAV